MLKINIYNFFFNSKKNFFFKFRTRNKKIETVLKIQQFGYYFEENFALILNMHIFFRTELPFVFIEILRFWQ